MRKVLSIIIALLGVVALNAQTPTDSAAMRALLVGRALPLSPWICNPRVFEVRIYNPVILVTDPDTQKRWIANPP